jgi:DNA repair protein RecN (Recombination protein N)
MLTSLRIQNLALIDELEITLEPGLTVLTGETGAGKSIIVGALSLALGDRPRPDSVREGAEQAVVEVLFDLDEVPASQSLLDSMGVADEDSQLVVRRVLNRKGKSRVYLNGRLSTISDLKRVVGPLVDISSQHAHTNLLKVPEHRAILDRYADLDEFLSEYRTAFDAWKASRAQLKSLLEAERDRVDRLDVLRFQLNEIEDVSLKPGEAVELSAEVKVLRSAADLIEAATHAENLISHGTHPVLDSLSDAETSLRRMGDADPTLELLASRLDSARIELEDIALEARDYRHRIEVDPRRLAFVEERLDSIRRLCRKYGPEEANVLERERCMRAELSDLEEYDERLAERQAEVEERHAAVLRAGRKLTQARTKAAASVGDDISAEVAGLGMPKAQFNVVVRPLEELQPHGADHVEFMLSSNVGEVPKPLSRVASGGELSRVMLALKRVLGRVDTVACYVFDEVDSGVSGAVAEQIGIKLKETARARQALCITHLPQVACHAEHQLRVHKEVADGRTVTRVTALGFEERREEIARLLAGLKVTDEARAHAEILLADASGGQPAG